MISLFRLCEFDISLRMVMDLVKKDVTYADIVLYGEKFLKTINGYNDSKISKIMRDISKINKEESLYDLFVYNVSLSIISCFKELDIKLYDFRTLNNNQLCITYNIKPTRLNINRMNKIRKGLKLFDENENTYIEGKHYEDILEDIIKEKTNKEDCSIINFKKYIKQNTKYQLEYFDGDLLLLEQTNKIIYTDKGIKYNKMSEFKIQSIDDIIATIDNEEERDILESRLRGVPLDDIGTKYNITKERVRQRYDKIYSKYFLYEMREDKYIDVFEKYTWDKDMFCEFYKEREQTFYYLKWNYKKGETEIYNIIDDIEITSEQKSIIYRKFKIIELFGQVIKKDKSEVLNVIIKEFAKERITTDEFFYIYNEVIRENFNLLEFREEDERNLESAVSRNKNTLTGFGKVFKYYNFDSIDSEIIKQLEELVKLSKGYYSTMLIFENNRKLMEEIDIQDEYELHNLLRKIFTPLDNVKFGKMPTFYTYECTREEFLAKVINEFAPIDLNELLLIIENDYGHKKSSMLSVIIQLFPNYVQGTEVIGNKYQTSEAVVKILNSVLTEDIYTMEDLENIIKKNVNEKVENIINTNVMYHLGYKMFSGYVMKSSIAYMETYLYNKILANDFYSIDEKLKQIQTFRYIIFKMELNLDIIKFSENKYITLKKMNQVGITKDDLKEYQKKVIDKYKDEELFSVKLYRMQNQEEALEKFGFEDIFFDSLIGSSEKIKKLSIDNNILFYKSKNTICKQEFIQRIIYKFRSITVIDIIKYLYNTYGIVVREWRIRELVKSTDTYYNTILDKSFVDKNEYYEEVFKNV